MLFADYAYFGVNYYGADFATSINDIIYNYTCIGLKHFKKTEPAVHEADISDILDLTYEIPKTHIKGDRGSSFTKQINDDFTFSECLTINQKNGNIDNYPMIIKICKPHEIGLESLDNNMTTDKVYAILPKVSCITERNYWFLSETLVQIFPPANDTKYKGILSTNDIDSIKSALDLQMDYIDIEINRLKSKTIGNRRQIVAEINDYLKKTYLPEAYKTEIEEVFGNQSNQKNLDEYLAELIANFKRLTADNIIYKKDLDFFEELYAKCYKIDTNKTEIAGQNVCLYDMVYKNKRPYFDMLSLVSESFVLSHIPSFMVSGTDFSADNIYAEYGKSLTIDNKTYPINKSGCIKLNPINSDNLNIANENLIDEIYSNIASDKYVKYVDKAVFYIIIAIFIAAFVAALTMHTKYIKWLVIFAELFVSIVIDVICTLIGYELNVVSIIILLIIFIFMGFICDAILNGDNSGQPLKNQSQNDINNSTN